MHKETNLLSLEGGRGGVTLTANIGKFQKQTGSHELSEGRNCLVNIRIVFRCHKIEFSISFFFHSGIISDSDRGHPCTVFQK